MPRLKENTEVLSKFSRTESAQKLKQLAENPFDFTKEGNLTSQRLDKYHAESCGYKLLYGLERITDDVMQALFHLAQETEAIKKMEMLQSGLVMNFIQGYASENRPALHTALRDFFDNPNPSKAASEAAKLAKREIDRLRDCMAKIDKQNRFTDLISVGIGGSDLGPKATYLALSHLQKEGRSVHFISNVDPDDAASVLKKIDLSKTLVLIISKSGTTLETLINEKLLRQAYQKAGLKSENHFISISSQGSPIDNKQNYLETFHLWDWVGGRFSVTSMVGGVALAFALGFDRYWEFLKGANAMDKAALNSEPNKNLPLLGALLGIWNRNFLGYSTLAIIPYSQALVRYPAHVQQVDMESNGKRIDQNGVPVDFETCPLVFGEPGTSAQHSFFQLLHQGTTPSPIEFIGFKRSQYGQDFEYQGTTSQEKLLANMFAQALALALGKQDTNPNKVFPGNRPSHILLGNQLTPYALGSLLAYYEHVAAFQGFIWDINSFDQEGVQLGKELAAKIIGRFAAKKGSKDGDNKPYPLGDSFLKLLDTM